jgi:hypothetical protein
VVKLLGNGTAVTGGASEVAANGSDSASHDNQQDVSTIVHLNAGDIVTLSVFQTSGGRWASSTTVPPPWAGSARRLAGLTEPLKR